jgi:hypothetical protein
VRGEAEGRCGLGLGGVCHLGRGWRGV